MLHIYSMEISLGTRLLLLRRESGMRQEDLAKASGISQAYIAKIERGRVTNVGIEYIFALAQALDVRVEYLLGLSDVVVDETEDDIDEISEGRAVYVVHDVEEHRMVQELFQMFQSLKPADRHFALGMMRRIAGGPRVIGDE